MGTTRFTALRTSQGLIVGTALAVGTAIGVGTTLQFASAPDIQAPGTTGAQITYEAYVPRKALTQTGGVATYNVLSIANPKTQTGIVLEMCIEVKTATPHATMTVDCGPVYGTATGVGLFNSQALSAGVHCAVPGATEVTWGPSQVIKCGSISGTGGGLVAEAIVKYRPTIID